MARYAAPTFALCSLVACALSAPQADAQIGPAEDAVPPNIFFVVDASSSMVSCLSGDHYDLDANGSKETCVSGSRLQAVKTALTDAVDGLGEAWVGLAQTDPTTNFEGLGSLPAINPVYPSIRAGVMVPLGASRARFKETLDDITLNSYDAVTLAESLRDLIRYFNTGYLHCNDTGICASSPIKYSCQSQENFVIVITDGTSHGVNALAADGSPVFEGYLNPVPDITNTNNPAMDDVATFMAKLDMDATLSNGRQRAYTYVISMDVTNSSELALFNSVATNASTRHISVHSLNELRKALADIFGDIQAAGAHEESPPVLSAHADKLLLGWYDVRSNNPLYKGQLLAWDIDDDPNSATYGQLLTNFWSPWDAGSSLNGRAVSAGEARVDTDHNNGEGVRDIFTNIDLDAEPDAFDSSNIATLCPLMLDTAASVVASGLSPGALAGEDLNGDGIVDNTDCQELVDFIRGYPLADFVTAAGARGDWKLGSIRHALPAVADPKPLIFTRNPVLREFLDDRLAEKLIECPSPLKGAEACDARVAFVAANDGMLHAINMHTGEELWAYIPRNLLGRTVGSNVEISSLIDLMWGEQLMMDSSPSISFTWIDGYQGAGVMGAPDGQQSPEEWVRLLVVGQGGGGRYYLGLDITQPDSPYILWEDTADTNTTSRMGATTSRPGTGIVLNNNVDTWVTFYGSGLELDNQPLDARLYIRYVGDLQGATETFADGGIQVTVDLNGDGVHDGVGLPSEPALIDRDNNGVIDEVYLASSNGALYKFVIDPSDPNNSTGCLFFNPENATLDTGATGLVKGLRTQTYYAPTAAIDSTGEVVVYWGTGSPYDMFSVDRGYFYVLHSSAGCNEGTLYTPCSFDGVVPLGLGERLMGSPLVYNGVIYFSTYAAASDRCNDGEGRLYGMDYQSCTAAFDTNNSGVSGDGDALYKSLGAGLPSAPLIVNGTIYVATGDADSSPQLQTIEAPNDPFASTSAIQYREWFGAPPSHIPTPTPSAAASPTP